LKRSTILIPAGCVAGVFLFFSPALRAQSDGTTPEWEIRKTITTLATECERLKPMLEQVKPQEWVAKGAPQAYVTQWNSARTQVQNMAVSAANLAREPERLTFAIDTYFRLQALDATLVSLGEGIRKYQNPALADLIRGVFSESSATREKLSHYVMEVAATQEQELKVVTNEAQRCRLSVTRQPRPAEKKVEAK
jgi:hypothetical protein